MSNNSSNEVEIFFWVILLSFAAATIWVAKSFGLDFTTAIQVVMGHILFIILIAAAIYLVKHDYVRWILILPFSIVAYLACWLPALDYWANKNIGSMAFEGTENSIWYGTGWTQALIALSIMGVGHGLIYYIDSNRGYR